MRRATIALALLALGACSRPAVLAADGGWVRLAANPGAPAAAYLTLHGGAADAVLTSVKADGARKAEMHETMAMGDGAMGGGMTTMAPLPRLAVPAGGEVAFKPGGRHVMLFDVDRGVRPGGEMVLTLGFAGGKPLTIHARVIAAGDPAPQ